MRRRAFLCSLALSAQSESAKDVYGGWSNIRLRASGFFRVDRVRGRWVLVTPDGHPYVALGANHVGQYFGKPEQSGPLLARFGGDRAKAEQAIYQAIRDMGLNAGEAYDPLLPSLKKRLPRIENLEFPGGQKFQFDVFDPAFHRELHETCVAQCREFAGDPWVIGVTYVDLPVWNSRRVDYYRALPPGAPGRRRYHQFLEQRYAGSIYRLNVDWRTRFASFAALRSAASFPALPDTVTPGRTAADEAFLGLIAAELYPRMKAAVRAGSPGHLFLGERFVLRMVPEPVLRAVGREVDVFCTQSLILSPQRPPEWQIFQSDGYRIEHQRTVRKPMLIIDWAAPFSLDTGYDTERGRVADEKEASDATAEFLRRAFAEDYIVGVFKCQLLGEHGNDRWFPAGRMKRTYLRDDGTPFAYRTQRTAQAHRDVLEGVYRRLRGN